MNFQNKDLAALVLSGPYDATRLSQIEAKLRDHKTLTFSRLPTGLFSASSANDPSTGYANVWVRDNVYVAYAHYMNGQINIAADVARALLRFFSQSRQRFEDIIGGNVSPQDVNRRPHVRFDGNRLSEISQERWSHAQNDALGYFLWLYSTLAGHGHVPLNDQAISILALFPRYFDAVRFWQDEDSGHWEENRKISASSIGVVVAGLKALLLLTEQIPDTLFHQKCQPEVINRLLESGVTALNQILPHECAELSPEKNRRYDAALLFLLYPLDVLNGAMAELVLHDVHRFLQGEIGIRRYLGDSYWAPDYDRLPPAERTRDYSEDVAERDKLLERIGDEAQWCIFDPILSALYGCRYLVSGSSTDLNWQHSHFNRALAQITPSWQCPELYYLHEGQYVPNPHSPLQWTQANLVVALKALRASNQRSL